MPLLYADFIPRSACDNPVCAAGAGGGAVYDLRSDCPEQGLMQSNVQSRKQKSSNNT